MIPGERVNYVNSLPPNVYGLVKNCGWNLLLFHRSYIRIRVLME